MCIICFKDVTWPRIETLFWIYAGFLCNDVMSINFAFLWIIFGQAWAQLIIVRENSLARLRSTKPAEIFIQTYYISKQRDLLGISMNLMWYRYILQAVITGVFIEDKTCTSIEGGRTEKVRKSHFVHFWNLWKRNIWLNVVFLRTGNVFVDAGKHSWPSKIVKGNYIV